jgi:hypothetical protein
MSVEKNYILFAIIGVFGFTTLGCEKHSPSPDNPAPENAGNTDSLDLSDTSIMESQKIANESNKTVANVMSFLKSESFYASESIAEKAPGKRKRESNSHTYKDFDYKKDGILRFTRIENYGRDVLIGDTSIGHEISALSILEINLSSCKPVISIKEPSFILEGNPSNLKSVVISGLVSEKSLSKKSDITGDVTAPLKRAAATMITEKDAEELDAKEFSETKEKMVAFTVTEDIAPRLKGALEDLLRAHGVEVSKY